ncbi:oxygen-insensitive NAD(P)H nitroreductase [Cognaticolwellia aestuarii]|uniref:oxygen-insensitive NAD(P)H nitroreductase n=1 Tax=Cognaticolwellia aestuarii TaxID=329993 RepID=UPI000987AFA0|nr:oxygen-insensitive NAD(P)H nitroreductase [Cognaticolwellia aestuarii]
MNNDITYYSTRRKTVKAYDESKKISPENIAKLKALLRYSPSSVNVQPWHFVLAATPEGKNKIAKSTDDLYPFNSGSIRNASHVIVFASRLETPEGYLEQLLVQEEKDGRFDGDLETFRAGMDAGRKMFINLHKDKFNDLNHWLDKQVYLNLGQLLLGAATLGIDATPMEGVDTSVLDEEFGLTEKGFTSLFVVTLGYSDAKNDFNATLPKSRLPYSDILTEV